MKTAIISIVLLSLFLPVAVAQQGGKVLCITCRAENERSNNFCTSCGSRIVHAVSKQLEPLDETFREPARLFSIPTASVIPEMTVGLTLGNSFGLQVGESFLGTASLGMGGIAELELSTVGLFAGLATGSSAFKTAGLKAVVIEEYAFLPSIAISLLSSNDWEREQRDEGVVRSSDAPAYAEGVRGVNYESRITNLTISFGKQVRERTTAHWGITFSDIRYRNVSTYHAFNGTKYFSEQARKIRWQGFGGVSIRMNPRTQLMGEVQSIPLFNYDRSTGNIRLDRMYIGAAGVRFSLSTSWSLDAGIRYQDNFIGLADTQVRITLHGVFGL
jgi:hypothetical protein